MTSSTPNVPTLPAVSLSMAEKEQRALISARYVERSNDALVGYCTVLDCLSWEAKDRYWAEYLEPVADGGLERLNELHDLIDGLSTATLDPTQNPGRIEALMIKALRSMKGTVDRCMRLAHHCDPALPSIVHERATLHLG